LEKLEETKKEGKMIVVVVEAKDEEEDAEIEERLYDHLTDVVNDLQVANAQFVDLEIYLVDDDSVEFIDNGED
jgi:hypothetical protein